MRDFASGVGYLARGFGFWGRRPKMMLLGAIPGVLATILVMGALIFLAFQIDDLSAWLTGFADSWSTGWRTTIQVFAGVVVFGLALWLAILLFTTLALLIGDPFYEAISGKVEEEYGPVPEAAQGFFVSIRNSIADALRMVLKSLVFGIMLFAISFIPLVGAIIALVLGAFVGGWFLAVELASYAFNRRGMRYREYRKLLAKRRGMALGLGTCVFLLFLIPLGAILVMPAAVAGATLMARDVLGEPTRKPPAVQPHQLADMNHR